MSEPLTVNSFQPTEALVPHLMATLTIGWSDPPASIGESLKGVPKENAPQERSRMNVLLSRCGAAAVDEIQRMLKSSANISFAAMSQVQQQVLGVASAPFRHTTAYTSVRPERYAYFEGVEDMFVRKVAKDDDDSVHGLLKAVRLYLDIQFFHPFADGNARAGMLWLAFSCWRQQLPLPDFRRLHGFDLRPGDRSCYWSFCEYVLATL